MRAWRSNATGELYHADRRRDPLDTLAPDRPSTWHEWINGGWVLPANWRDKAAEAEVVSINRFIFEILLAAENDNRELRSQINLLKPDSFTQQESSPVTRLQYRAALINLWKALNP